MSAGPRPGSGTGPAWIERWLARARSVRGRADAPRGTGDGDHHAGNGESHAFGWTVAGLAAAYLGLRFGVPYLTVWLGLSEYPAPVPRFALWIYMACAVIGAVVLAASDEAHWRAFLAPVVRLVVLERGRGYTGRLLVLGCIPLLTGWFVWRQLHPGPPAETVYRLQHPTIPSGFAELRNPFAPSGGEWPEEAVREGIVLYQKNCRPCHGATGQGDGPLAAGLRLRPIDFQDRGTLATLVESYVYWRIHEGFRALPAVSTPWHSAMPSWGAELDQSEIWRLVMAAYRVAGREPRRLEGDH